MARSGQSKARVLVLGSGVAGLAAAIAARQIGLQVRIVERRATNATVGAGVVLWPNGLRALRELGVHREVALCSGPIRRMRSADPAGRERRVVEFGPATHAGNEAPGRAVLREVLLGALLRRLAELEVRVEYGRQVERIEGRPNGTARVWLSDGRFESADLIVGAEGRMNSRARRFVTDDPRDGPRYQGFVNWLGVFESDEALLREGEMSKLEGPQVGFGIVPISRKQAYWAAAGPASLMDRRNQVLDRLSRHLEPFAEPVPTLVAAALSRSFQPLIWVHDVDPIARWHRGNVILIGDCAHATLPSSGQGASQALVDAVTLVARIHERGISESTLADFATDRIAETNRLILVARESLRRA